MHNSGKREPKPTVIMSIGFTEREIVLLVEGAIRLRENASPKKKGRQPKNHIGIAEVEALLVKLCIAQRDVGRKEGA